MKLFAISDLHVGIRENRDLVAQIAPHPDDWLILAGDLGETEAHLRFVFETLGPRFAKLVWVPGNHELYVSDGGPRGVARYDALIAYCRSAGVLTPEDPYPVWEGEGGPHVIAPLFILYDYSFRPSSVTREHAVQWAGESGVRAADEALLDPAPHATRDDWCRARVTCTEARLDAAPRLPKVLINHFPLREDQVWLPFIPRFSIWCGTTATTDWHLRYDARVVVSGHLHIPRTRYVDGVRFEEVSLGYPRDRAHAKPRPIASYLRQILPHPE